MDIPAFVTNVQETPHEQQDASRTILSQPLNLPTSFLQTLSPPDASISSEKQAVDEQELKRAKEDEITKLINKNKCTVCGKILGNSSNLRHHMWIHTGRYDYTCAACGKKFRRKQSLKRHHSTHMKKSTCDCDVCRMPNPTLSLNQMPHPTQEIPLCALKKLQSSILERETESSESGENSVDQED